jgi:hypothetical protein
MQALHDETTFAWIRSGCDELVSSQHPEWRGNFVSHLMPPVFEAYTKILHRIEARFENIDKPLSPREIAILKIPPCEGLRSFVESRRTGAQAPRIRWKELAEALNVPFGPQISHEWYRKKLEEGCWPRFLYGPGEGLLDGEARTHLVSVLKPFTDSGECFFRFAEIPFILTGKPLLFGGTLEELGGFLESGGYQLSPEYWGPSEKRWCVCSDYDLKFTVVGGSRNLISALLASNVLECLEVTPQTRIDYLAPMP